MSESIIFDKKKYVPATDAGKYFGYTKDYMLMLAKQGKIEGQKVGHKWFINLPSTEAYFIKAKYERELRRKKLSLSRKKELNQNEDKGVHVKQQALQISSRKISSVHVALFETVVIVLIGVSVGSFGYFGSTSTALVSQASASNFLNTFAISVYEFFGGARNDSEVRVYVVEDTQPSQFVEGSPAVSMRLGTTTHTSLIVAPEEMLQMTEIASIQESFSDTVTVSFDEKNSNAGIVIPQFRDGEGDLYRFLMVPLEAKVDTP